MAIRSRQEVYESIVTEIESIDPRLTDFNEGSNIDIVAAIVSAGVDELSQITQDEFRKTFFDTANGSEVTGGPDDLEALAIDHFGDSFERPKAVEATGIVTFSRENADAGDVLIPKDTTVKTQKNSAGNSVSFKTVSEVILTGTSINASVKAVNAGPSGNVNSGTVTVIESSLSDPSVVVTNPSSFGGGKEAENDAEYRSTIKLLLETLKGATLGAIEAKAKSVAGVVFAKAIETIQYVKEWDIVNDIPIGDVFRIVRAKVFVADANGNASSELIKSVNDAVAFVRACGVRVEIVEAIPVSISWDASLTLNPSGPNYATFQSDLTIIKEQMSKYIVDRPVGSGFERSSANAYIMAKYGPSGTNDISSFSTSTPSADVTVGENEKLLPDAVTINGE